MSSFLWRGVIMEGETPTVSRDWLVYKRTSSNGFKGHREVVELNLMVCSTQQQIVTWNNKEGFKQNASCKTCFSGNSVWCWTNRTNALSIKTTQLYQGSQMGIIGWKWWPGSVVRMAFLSNVTVVDHILSIINQSLGLRRPSPAFVSLPFLIIIIVIITECITNLFHWKYLQSINVRGFGHDLFPGHLTQDKYRKYESKGQRQVCHSASSTDFGEERWSIRLKVGVKYRLRPVEVGPWF